MQRPERRAMRREVVKMKKAEYMRDRIGEEYEGVISGVTKWGLYVELPNTVEGLIMWRTCATTTMSFWKRRMN